MNQRYVFMRSALVTVLVLAGGCGGGGTDVTPDMGGAGPDLGDETPDQGSAPTVPAAPSGVWAVADATQATIYWSAVAGATSYEIYWGSAPGISAASTRVSGVTSPHVQLGLQTGETFYYRIAAVNSVGTTLSAEASVLAYAPTTFTDTDTMHAARQLHRAVRLDDGRVLLVGGASVATSAELFDPSSQMFDPTGDLGVALEDGHTATLLLDGTVLVTGGFNSASGTSLDSAERYDPTTGSFTSTGDMLFARRGHTATLLTDGRVLLIGGLLDSAAASSSVEIYDPATGTFSQLGLLGRAVRGHSATLLTGDRILITGGYGGDSGSVILSAASVYDPNSGTDTAVGTMASPRVGHTATLLPSGLVLVAGGVTRIDPDTSAREYLSTAELFEPAAAAFSAAGNTMTRIRAGHTATLLPNGMTLLVAGAPYSSAAATDSELFDPSTRTFSVTGAFPTGRYNHAATLLQDGSVLVTGGAYAFGVEDDAYLFVSPSP